MTASRPPTPASGLPPGRQIALKLTEAPKSRTVAARGLALDLVLGAKAAAVELFEDFRARDRFFKYKALVITLWAGLSLTTLAATCQGTGPQGPSGSLRAYAKLVQTTLGVTTLLLENHSKARWEGLRLKLNGQYAADLKPVEAGGHAVVELSRFKDPAGRSPPPGLSIDTLEIESAGRRARIRVDSP